MKQSRLLKLREYPKVAQPLTDKVRRKEKKSPAQQKQNKECFILSSAHVMELSNSHPSKLTAPSLLHCQLKHCPRKDPMVLSFSFQLFSYSPVPRTYSSIRAKSLQLYLPLWSYGLQPARLLCPWDCSGKNTGVGCHPPFSAPHRFNGSSWPRDHTQVSCGFCIRFFTAEPPGKPLLYWPLF